MPLQAWCEMKIEDILIGLKKGQEVAFRGLFDAYYDELVLFAHHILKDPEAAEDVVQECFVDFWTHRRFENMTEGLDKYLFQAVKHASLNYIRGCQRRERRHELAVKYGAEDAEVGRIEEEEIEALYLAIHQLPEDRRKIFMMICLGGKKYQEVADMLGISINTVKTQMGRSFQFLRSALKNHRFSLILLVVWHRWVDQ